MKKHLYTFLILIIVSTYLQAGEANIIKVEIQHSFDDVYNFNVTVVHQDEGWKHFANGWEVLSPQGKVLAVRVLQHPHVNDQPFTRSMQVKIPEGISEVIIRAHDLVHEYGGCEITVGIPEKGTEDGT